MEAFNTISTIINTLLLKFINHDVKMPRVQAICISGNIGKINGNTEVEFILGFEIENVEFPAKSPAGDTTTTALVEAG